LVKRKTKLQAKGKPQKWGFPYLPWLAIALGIVAIVVLALVRTLPASEPASSTPYNGLKAAIVDQLHNLQSNQVFIEHTTQGLQDYGFEVDVYQTDDVTVDFYRKLPTYGYRLIVFRVHSGLLIGSESVANQTWLFTSEPYSRIRYFFQQMRGQVTNATTTVDTTPVFAVGAKFITQMMEEKFTNTAIIMMGCAGSSYTDLAQAFIQNGASTYLAWDASVGLNYVDDTTITLIEKLILEELTISEAVAETMEEKGPDPNNNAVLKYYPPASANKTIRQLIE